MSLAGPHLESDHSPLRLVLSRPRAKGPFRVPRWVPEHLAYRAFADEYSALLPQLPEDPFCELRQTTMALQHAAKRVMHLPASMHIATRPSWLCHWLFQGCAAWHRRDCSVVERVVRRVPDHTDLLMDSGGLLAVFPEERFAELIGDLMRTILMAELSDDIRRATTDEKARALRARFHRKLASWSPKRRVIQTMLVVSEDGAPYPTGEEQASALSDHWSRQFSETRRIDRIAAEGKLRYWSTLQSEELRPLDYAGFSALFDHLPHAAPGPDGLPYTCWSAAGERVRRVLFDVYIAIAGGADVPSDFNESYMAFYPEGDGLARGVCLPGPSIALPPPQPFQDCSENRFESIERFIGNSCHDARFADTAGFHQESVAPRQHSRRGVRHGVCCHRWRAPDCHCAFRYCCSFPSVEWEWLMLVLERQGIATWVRHLLWGMLLGSSTTILFAGAVTGATTQIRRGIRQGCPSSGSLWALLFDPLVRSLIAVIPPTLGLAGCFANDLACSSCSPVFYSCGWAGGEPCQIYPRQLLLHVG